MCVSFCVCVRVCTDQCVCVWGGGAQSHRFCCVVLAVSNSTLFFRHQDQKEFAKMLGKLDQSAVAYASTTLGSTLMSSVWGFYYVKVFLNKYQVSESWFHMSQIIFMFWNAINDPLFGYIQDNMNVSWVRSRRHSILYGAPLYAISFLVPWFPWGTYAKGGWLAGAHLLFALCLWDTLLTFVLLAQCSLFAEMSQKHEDRLRLIKYTQYASLIGCSAVSIVNLVSSNLEQYENFQMCTFVIAILAYICLRYTGNNAFTEYDQVSNSEPLSSPPSSKKGSHFSVWTQMKQIGTQVSEK